MSYTPTTEKVKHNYGAYGAAREEFDRWLSGELANAWERGANDMAALSRWSRPWHTSGRTTRTGKGRVMTRVKPCAKCNHPKTHHRTRECRKTWQAMGATFMGNRRVTKWCLCDGYKPRKGSTDE